MRDEQANLADCLQGLLGLTGKPKIWIIDDGSTDGTAAIAADFAARESRLHVVAARPLARGWRGKTNALASGLEFVESPWILLVDADSRLSPDSAARALAHAQHHGLDAVSLAATQVATKLGEDLLVPGVFWFLDALLGDWHTAATGGPAVAAGQFLLVRTDALHAAGGFAAIRGATLDDVELMRLLRDHGGRTGFVRAPDLLQVRMYDGGRAAAAGWRRNLAVILTGKGRVLGATLALLAATLLAPALALWPTLTGAGSWSSIGLYGSGVAASAINRWSGGQRIWTALLWPLEALRFGLVLGNAERDRRLGRLTPWKGRAIALD